MAFTVLELIHACGWVHRDISVGNMYLYQGHGLLADLEHAKRTCEGSDNQVRMVCFCHYSCAPLDTDPDLINCGRERSISWPVRYLHVSTFMLLKN